MYRADERASSYRASQGARKLCAVDNYIRDEGTLCWVKVHLSTVMLRHECLIASAVIGHMAILGFPETIKCYIHT